MSRIVTFYSYKGGVGRTFALANIAVLLARRGKKVLTMDWDLEAPGLYRYFKPYLPSDLPLKNGIIHLLGQAVENPQARWNPFVTEVQISNSPSISFISSGDQSADYVERVRAFSWIDFFENRRGGAVLDRWRTEWKKAFDFVLIDSRTGITDTGGVCTVFLPDILVLVFSTNEQSLERGIQIIHGVQESRRKLAVPRPPAAILPLPSRFDGRNEVDEAKRWLDRFDRDLKPFYDDWLPKRFEPRQILELTKVPYITRFSFGEPLPVLSHGISDPELPGFYLENVTRLLATDFQDAAQILEPEVDAPEAEEPYPRAVFQLIDSYITSLSAIISKVRLLGEAESRELQKVFVELNISEEYHRPSARNEWRGFMNPASLERRLPLRPSTFNEQKIKKRMVRPEELLSDGTSAVIIGAAGCGKSTLLRWLAGKVISDHPSLLPVFLELKSINQELFKKYGGSLVELLFEQAIKPLVHFENPLELRSLQTEFKTRLAENQVAIFLDGLDEVRNTEFFRPLCDAINHFTDSSYGRNLLIISTRPNALDVRFQDMKEMEIAPFDQDQIALLLDHYYGEDEGRKLLPKLMSPDLSDLVSVPTLIGAIARRIHLSGKIETDRLKLYEGIVDDLAVRIDSQKNVERFRLDDHDGRLKLAFLTQLAFDRLFDDGIEQGKEAERVTFTTDFIEASARRFCRDAREAFTLAADVKATPMVREVAENVWSFSHLTLQEYLAAKALAAHPDCESAFVRGCFHPLLVEMETLPMALGMVRNPDRMYETLEQLPESLDHKLLRLRARGLASAKVKPQTLQKMLQRLDDFITSARPEETPYFDSVVRAFAQARGEALDAVALGVAARLNSANGSSVRGRAATALGRIGSERAVGALLKSLLEDREADVRGRAAAALETIAGEKGVATLIEDLKDADSDAHESAASVLRKIRVEKAFAKLIEDLKDEDSIVRGSAAWTLGKAGGEQAVPALIEDLKDADSEVRQRAAGALEQIKVELLAKGLQSALSHANGFVRRKAVEVISYYSNREKELELLAVSDPDPEVKQAAEQALTGLKSKKRYFDHNK